MKMKDNVKVELFLPGGDSLLYDNAKDVYIIDNNRLEFKTSDEEQKDYVGTWLVTRTKVVDYNS